MSYSGKELKRGMILAFDFSNLPAKKTHFLWLIVVLAFIAIFAVILVPSFLRRKAELRGVTREEGEDKDEMKALLVKIA
ncbi:MAG: hypothetical protein GTN43_00680, partial [Candidatus Aenigmarchaeota archaeon]|nr:hypothetical protein [Candidatus Aenigmarchaeota archaeon]